MHAKNPEPPKMTLAEATIKHQDLLSKVSKKYLDIMHISTDERPTPEMIREYNQRAEAEFMHLVETGEPFQEFNPYGFSNSPNPCEANAAVENQTDLNADDTIEPESLENQVEIWKTQTEKDLIALAEKSKGITIAGHIGGEKEGLKVVHALRMEGKNARIAVENRRQELKDGILQAGKKIDAAAKHLTAIISPEESRLEAEEKAYTAKLEAAKAKLEQEAKARLNARLEQLRQLEAPIDIDKAQHSSVEDWNEIITLLSLEKKERDEKKAESQRIDDEKKAEKDRADKIAKDAEAARLADEQKKLDKQREEQRIEAQRIDDEKKALAAKQKAIDDENKRIADEAENLRQKEAKDAQEAKEKADKKTADDAEAARIEALRPDMEKAEKWAKDIITAIESVKIPEVESLHVMEMMVATIEGITEALSNLGESK